MSKKSANKPLALAISAAFVGSLAATSVNAANPFGMEKVTTAQTITVAEAKCGEGKCGSKKKAKKKDGKCGEAKCGAKKKEKKKEAKCGEGKCGGKK